MEKVSFEILRPTTLQMIATNRLAASYVQGVIDDSNDTNKRNQVNAFSDALFNLVERAEEWDLTSAEASICMAMAGTQFAADRMSNWDVNEHEKGQAE